MCRCISISNFFMNEKSATAFDKQIRPLLLFALENVDFLFGNSAGRKGQPKEGFHFNFYCVYLS